MRVARAASAAVAVGLAVCLIGAAPAAAKAERMYLQCDSGLVIERSNGFSWWGVASDGARDGSVYTTRDLSIVDADGNVVYEHHFGQASDRRGTVTCVASHFDWTWTVELTRVR